MTRKYAVASESNEDAKSLQMIAGEFYLAAKNLETSIDHYLFENGVMLDSKTREFLAKARDTMSSVAERAEYQIAGR